MTPQQAIEMLDRQISRHGEVVRLTRGANEENVRAFVRKSKPDVLASGQVQGTRTVTFSPSGLGPFDGVVKAGDWVRIGEEPELAVDPKPEVIRMNGVIVRINATVTG